MWRSCNAAGKPATSTRLFNWSRFPNSCEDTQQNPGKSAPVAVGRNSDVLQRQFFTLLIVFLADTISPSGPVAPLPLGLTTSPHAHLHKGNRSSLQESHWHSDPSIHPGSHLSSLYGVWRARGRRGAHLPSHPWRSPHCLWLHMSLWLASREEQRRRRSRGGRKSENGAAGLQGHCYDFVLWL